MKTNNLLYPYAPSVGVYHCPGDVRFRNSVGSGNTTGWAYDSYSVTENVSGTNAANGTVYSKGTQIRRPSDCFTFVEQADSRGYNNGNFEFNVTRPTPFTWTISFVDLFATYHGNVGTFCFADGHAEGRKWTDSGIIYGGSMANRSGTQAFEYSNFPTTDRPSTSTKSTDTAWLIQHWLMPSNP